MYIENDEEYDVIRPYKNKNIINSITTLIPFLLIIFLIVYILICVVLTNEAIKISEEQEYTTYSKINFENGIVIPTLLSTTHYNLEISSTYRLEDDRFGDRVTTIEILYNEIPEDYLSYYKFDLLKNNYNKLEDLEENISIYVKNELDEKASSFVVIVGNTKIIYGTLEGTYDRIFY